jgi:hypothetical protein
MSGENGGYRGCTFASSQLSLSQKLYRNWSGTRKDSLRTDKNAKDARARAAIAKDGQPMVVGKVLNQRFIK